MLLGVYMPSSINTITLGNTALNNLFLGIIIYGILKDIDHVRSRKSKPTEKCQYN
jgi:hypothetical protein